MSDAAIDASDPAKTSDQTGAAEFGSASLFIACTINTLGLRCRLHDFALRFRQRHPYRDEKREDTRQAQQDKSRIGDKARSSRSTYVNSVAIALKYSENDCANDCAGNDICDYTDP